MARPKPCGTPAAYQRHHRHGEEPCEACVDAWNAYHRRYRHRRPTGTRPVQHGTPSTYTNWSCRCEPCTSAWAEYRRAQRAGIDPSDELARLIAEQGADDRSSGVRLAGTRSVRAAVRLDDSDGFGRSRHDLIGSR